MGEKDRQKERWEDLHLPSFPFPPLKINMKTLFPPNVGLTGLPSPLAPFLKEAESETQRYAPLALTTQKGLQKPLSSVPAKEPHRGKEAFWISG